MRIGQGYDVTQIDGRKGFDSLGGVKVPYEKGLLGHSDADVLVHAVMDALLGRRRLGISEHFPDTDPAYRGISSVELLKRWSASGREGVCDREHRCDNYCPET